MDLTTNRSISLVKEKKESKKLLRFYIWESISLAFKGSGLLVWIVIFFWTLLEVKQYYNIDVIPGYNSSVDDFYGAVKGTISEFFK